MKAIITRLRASKEEYKKLRFKDGREEGQWWALNKAAYSELQALEIKFGCGQVRYEDDCDSAFSPGERFFFAINPDQDGFRRGAQEFWANFHMAQNEDVLLQSAAWVNGFIDGALRAWKEVKGKI